MEGKTALTSKLNWVGMVLVICGLFSDPAFQQYLGDLVPSWLLPKLMSASRTPIVLVSPQIRAALKQITAAHLPQLVVLSYNEITRDTKIESVGIVSDAIPGK